MPPPLIAVTPNVLPPEDRRFYKGKALDYGERALACALLEAGGLPAILPLPASAGALPASFRPSPELRGAALAGRLPALAAHCEALADRFDGLVLSGGEDLATGWYTPGDVEPDGNPARDAFELLLYAAFLARGRPVLGVCRGAQLLGVAEGGALHPDLPTHRCQARYDALSHSLTLAPASLLEALWGDEPRTVNSVHHQALIAVPPGLEPLAESSDGIPEAFARPGGPFVLGVQWHPEWMTAERPSQRRLFAAFVAAARPDVRRAPHPVPPDVRRAPHPVRPGEARSDAAGPRSAP
jgi:putative glutamine amidotransferase